MGDGTDAAVPHRAKLPDLLPSPDPAPAWKVDSVLARMRRAPDGPVLPGQLIVVEELRGRLLAWVTGSSDFLMW